MPSLAYLDPEKEFIFNIDAEGKCQPLDFTLKNENPSKKNITFKIKTTEPGNYIVKPNVGVIRPGEKVVVTITMNFSKNLSSHKF